MSAADLSTEELMAYVKARLVVAGFDLSKLPTVFDPTTGVPTQESLLASLRTFVLANPGAINTWRPPSGYPADEERYGQQVSPPLEYPSIVEAWTGKVDR